MKLKLFNIVFLTIAAIFTQSACSQEEQKSQRIEDLNFSHGSLQHYIHNKYVLEALDLTMEQRQNINKSSNKFGEDYTKTLENPPFVEVGVKRLPNGKITIVNREDTPQYKAHLAKLQTIRDKLKTSVAEILLPHQKKRLVQIVFQRRLHGKGAPFQAYVNRDLPKYIGGLTAVEKSVLKKAVSENYQQYNAEILELKKKYEMKMRSMLPKEKRDKVNELMGEPFLWLHTIK